MYSYVKILIIASLETFWGEIKTIKSGKIAASLSENSLKESNFYASVCILYAKIQKLINSTVS